VLLIPNRVEMMIHTGKPNIPPHSHHLLSMHTCSMAPTSREMGGGLSIVSRVADAKPGELRTLDMSFKL
jgi:hypothetical protein